MTGNKQPEALRLAELFELESDPDSLYRKAATELRRQHQEHIEDQNVIAVWRGRTQRAEAERDMLLEALKRAEPHLVGPRLLEARAAIALVGGGND